MEMCRACLSTGNNMIPMDESAINIFNDITNLNIKRSDHMLLYTCEECHKALMFCKQFKDKCIASDRTLNEILFPGNKKKLESDCEDNDYYVVINNESDENIMKHEMSDVHYDSEIDEVQNDNTFKPTFEIIIEPATENVTGDINYEEIQNPQRNAEIFCGLCSAKFIDKNMLIEHLPTHNDDNSCRICLETCNSKSELLAHRMQHVPDEQKGCLFCHRAFVSSASLQFHYMTVHKLESKIFDELKQDYFHNFGTSPTKENVVASEAEKIAKVKRKKIIVDTDTVILTETELKKLLEKPKKGFVPYYCGVCPQELEDKRQLMRHLTFHKMDTHCSLCGLEYTDYPHLLAHRLAHIPDSQNSCLFCPMKISDETGLEQHYLENHKFNEAMLPYFCKNCLCSYETEKQLKKHMKYKHGAIKYICDYCSKGFRQKGTLISHIMSHLNVRHYKCDLCDYRAKFSGAIKEHILRRHTKTRVYCRFCRRAFPTIEMLDRHKPCIVDGDIVCPICGLNLKMTSNLTRHMLTHTDIHKYKCELCPAQYKSKSSFDSHMNKHNGTRKYECEYCPMKFYSQPVLIKHRRIHTGERPYACKLCDRSFTGNHNLKVHMRVHGLEVINRKK